MTKKKTIYKGIESYVIYGISINWNDIGSEKEMQEVADIVNGIGDAFVSPWKNENGMWVCFYRKEERDSALETIRKTIPNARAKRNPIYFPADYLDSLERGEKLPLEGTQVYMVNGEPSYMLYVIELPNDPKVYDGSLEKGIKGVGIEKYLCFDGYKGDNVLLCLTDEKDMEKAVPVADWLFEKGRVKPHALPSPITVEKLKEVIKEQADESEWGNKA